MVFGAKCVLCCAVFCCAVCFDRRCRTIPSPGLATNWALTTTATFYTPNTSGPTHFDATSSETCFPVRRAKPSSTTTQHTATATTTNTRTTHTTTRDRTHRSPLMTPLMLYDAPPPRCTGPQFAHSTTLHDRLVRSARFLSSKRPFRPLRLSSPPSCPHRPFCFSSCADSSDRPIVLPVLPIGRLRHRFGRHHEICPPVEVRFFNVSMKYVKYSIPTRRTGGQDDLMGVSGF